MQRKHRIRAGMATIGVASLAFAAVAIADTIKVGSTGHGADVQLTVSDFGNATKMNVSSVEVECKHGTLTTGDLVFKKFDTSDPGSFKDKSKDNGRDGQIKFKSKTKIQGSSADGIAWNGTYKRTTKVFQGKDKLDTCRQNTTWDAA
jgi:hypothetical protein